MAGLEKGASQALRSEAAHTASIDRSLDRFSHYLGRYRKWCDELAIAIAEYQTWNEQEQSAEGEQDLRVYELIEALKTDKLKIALVAEFSRGKSELLNAIFFADYKQRLLPSGAGRTTMCPTELRYNEKEGTCIKLLPIETRKTALTISEYKNTSVHWTILHILKATSAEEVRQAFLEVTKTKKVNVREAKELGLYKAEATTNDSQMVDVPVWRHAIINYPHPLLRQGLLVLDTPGLNALGTEPELTLKMIPDAHAVMFVLAADIGVSRTDLELWNNHVSGNTGVSNNARIVVLNKIDALWDELQNKTAVAQIVKQQINETARTLGVEPSSIFAVSAQKGLVGKVKGDEVLIEKSGLPALELKLAQDILPAKYEIIRSKVVYEIDGRVQSSLRLVESKLKTVSTQIADLKKLGGKNLDAIQKLVGHMRSEKQRYDKELEGFEITRETLAKQAKYLLAPLNMSSLDELIQTTRREMRESWTTHGLKSGMETFFEGALLRMEKVSKQAEEIKKIVERIYERLHTEYGLIRLHPTPLLLAPYLMELKNLETKAEAFRNSPMVLVTEQRFVIKKFFITLVSQTRQTFNECNAVARSWFQGIVTPVFGQIRDHKALIDRNLEMLKKIHKNMDHLGDHIAALEALKQTLEGERKMLGTLLERLHQPLI